MNKLTPKQVIMLNTKVTGSVPVLSDEQQKQLEDLCEVPYELDEKFFYICRSTVEKAARLGCEIADKKVFNDKNEETALLSMLTLLEVNGVRVKDYGRDKQMLMEDLSKYDEKSIRSWISGHRKNSEKISVLKNN